MVEFKLDPLQAELPKDCYVSVRVGEVQKLSRFAGPRSFRFGGKLKESAFGRIEVFRRIGACSIDIESLARGPREVDISCSDGAFKSLGLRIGMDGAAEGLAPLEPAKAGGAKANAAKEYLDKHSIEVRLSEAMLAVLQERPEDPFQFLSAHLAGRRAGGKPPPELGGLSPTAKAPPAAKETRPGPRAVPPPVAAVPPGLVRTPARARPIIGSWLSDKLASRPTSPSAGLAATRPLSRMKTQAVFGLGQAPGAVAGPAVLKKAVTGPPRPGAMAVPPVHRAVAVPVAAKPAAAPAAAAAAGRKGFASLPSVGTWLQKRPPTNKKAAAPLHRSLHAGYQALRGLRGFPVPGAASPDEVLEIERVLSRAFFELSDEFPGQYFPLPGSTSYGPRPGGTTAGEAAALAAKGLLFDVPVASGRGVFDGPGIAAWVNEGQHLRIMITEEGIIPAEAAKRLTRFETALAEVLYADGQRLG